MRRKVMLGAGALIALFIVGGCARLAGDVVGSGPSATAGISAGSKPHPPTEDECVAELKQMIVRDNPYPWTTIDRIAFYSGSTQDFVEITLNEIHRGDDGADINTNPRIDTFRRYPNGEWYSDRFLDQNWVPYDEWLRWRRSR